VIILIEKLNKDNRKSEAEVLDAYRLLINDPEISDMINEDHDLKEIFDMFKNTSDEMMKFEDEYFKQRAEDIISIGKEIIFTMQNINIILLFIQESKLMIIHLLKNQ